MPLSSGLLLWHLKWKPLQSWDLLVMYRQTFHPRLGSGSPPQCPCKGHEPLLPSHIPTPTPALLHRWPSQGLRMGTISILPNRSLPDSFENSQSKPFHNLFSNPNALSQVIICAAQEPHLVSGFPPSRCMLLGRVGPTPTPKNTQQQKRPQNKQKPHPKPKKTSPTTIKYVSHTTYLDIT